MNSPEELKRRLSQRFSADNLSSAATLAFESSWNHPHSVGLFVVERVLRILAEHWDVAYSRDQAWMTNEASVDMENRLRPPLFTYLDALDDPLLDSSAEMRLLRDIVDALFRWTAEGPDPRPRHK